MEYNAKPFAGLFAATAILVLPMAADAQDGSTLTVAMSTFSEQTMTPWAGSGQRKSYLDLTYEYLTYVGPDGEAMPGLATEWEMSDEGRTWVFHLREGVPFSDESCGDVTATDVAYSIERIIDEDSRAGPANQMRRLIEGVEIVDDATVRVTLSTPDFALARGLFSDTQQMGIVCRSYIEALGPDADAAPPVGTGPYELETSVEASEIVMRLRDDLDGDHWRISPAFDRIALRVVPEEATRVAMLRAGEADIAPIGFDSIPGLRDAGVRIVAAERTWTPVIRLGGLVQTDPARYNPDLPWADVRVRQAMNLAIDKQAIIDELFQGEGIPANADAPDVLWDSVQPYPYDPDRARELLAEAGYPDGFDVTMRTFTTSPGAELPLMAEAAALYWADVGINVSIQPADWPTVRSDWTSGAPLDYVFTHRGFPWTSTEIGLDAAFSDLSVFASFTSEELEQRIAEMREITDIDARNAALTEIGQYIRDEAAAVFMVHANEPYGVGPRVAEWSPGTSYGFNFAAALPAE
ncbi:hypothetical protein HKCCE2091_06650 [Rhodobacterales bacterium HKCCE2091]|nr:hypothetical protein [Rhodobacterales bacterium HKCCE2091]